MNTISEENKKTELGEDALDAIAGGNMQENFDILNAMMKLDPDGVQAVLNKAANEESQISIVKGTMDLVAKHFGKDGIVGTFSSEMANVYASRNGQPKKISHDELLQMIDNKANGLL